VQKLDSALKQSSTSIVGAAIGLALVAQGLIFVLLTLMAPSTTPVVGSAVIRKHGVSVQTMVATSELVRIDVNSMLVEQPLQDPKADLTDLSVLVPKTATASRKSTVAPPAIVRSKTQVSSLTKGTAIRPTITKSPTEAATTLPPVIPKSSQAEPTSVAIPIEEVKAAPVEARRNENNGVSHRVADAGAPVVLAATPTPTPRPIPEKPAGETRPPQVIRSAIPNYPSIARSQRISGMVLVEITVAADGSVENAVIVKSPSPLLNKAAQRAARKMKFSPALADGKPIRAKKLQPFHFSLK